MIARMMLGVVVASAALVPGPAGPKADATLATAAPAEATGALADGQSGPQFKGYADLENVVQIATGVSPDKLAATVIFRNLEADVWGGGGSLTGTRAVTVALPITGNDKPVGVTQDIRGYVSTQGKARVSLVVQSGGKTHVIDLKAASDKPSDSKSRKYASGPSESLAKAKSQATQQAENLPPADEPAIERSFDFNARILSVIPAGASYKMTFGLLAERDTADGDNQALLVVDTLDVEIVKPAAK